MGPTEMNFQQRSRSMGQEFENRLISRFFAAPKAELQSLGELLQSYEIALQAGANLAQIFAIPLASDSKAAGIGPLFSSLHPQVLEVEDSCDSLVNWADVIRSAVYDAEFQQTGKYHVRIEKGNALLELPQADHDFISTGIPRQLVDPYSYPSDISSEINATKLTLEQMTHWQDIISGMSHTTGNALKRLEERLELLKRKLGALVTHDDMLRNGENAERDEETSQRRRRTPLDS
ncbi:hypothetical protein N7468_003548 [Penicillium chermesinum]|uniref:Uncharacterized protein n=1 Tax=Penicillium chermesinum TaxID=63820 RepID=A0A9W9TTG8_9EURO|nr:uncharacterized protein N7468_003548 [Penicillium chermesinum]KAJ5238929.1 hypothetical protein N7468_003548 [Penicillium chermesinum]KAJ6164570.1 hypothetical protein N7470_003242 [Penicillium chermesinum]